jgi:N-acetylglutamate synthase-like GNAT family acetyltransferase
LSEKIENSLRFATGADAPKVAALVNAAYGRYIERIGMLPRPMTDDYAEVIANQRVTVAQSHATIVGVIVLSVGDEGGFLIDNVAVDPSMRGKGLGKPSLSLRKPKPGAEGSITFICTRMRR